MKEEVQEGYSENDEGKDKMMPLGRLSTLDLDPVLLVAYDAVHPL